MHLPPPRPSPQPTIGLRLNAAASLWCLTMVASNVSLWCHTEPAPRPCVGPCHGDEGAMPLVLPPMDFLAGAAAIPIHGKRLRGGQAAATHGTWPACKCGSCTLIQPCRTTSTAFLCRVLPGQTATMQCITVPARASKCRLRHCCCRPHLHGPPILAAIAVLSALD